jgi:hypothetical protein
MRYSDLILKLPLSLQSDWLEDYILANGIGSQVLIRNLDPAEATSWNRNGVTISAKKIGTRSGVPKDASTWLYTLTAEQFVVQVRAVWHRGDLLRPLTTHCRVIKIAPETAEACCSYNTWLRSTASI